MNSPKSSYRNFPKNSSRGLPVQDSKKITRIDSTLNEFYHPSKQSNAWKLNRSHVTAFQEKSLDTFYCIELSLDFTLDYKGYNYNYEGADVVLPKDFDFIPQTWVNHDELR